MDCIYFRPATIGNISFNFRIIYFRRLCIITSVLSVYVTYLNFNLTQEETFLQVVTVSKILMTYFVDLSSNCRSVFSMKFNQRTSPRYYFTAARIWKTFCVTGQCDLWFLNVYLSWLFWICHFQYRAKIDRSSLSL